MKIAKRQRDGVEIDRLRAAAAMVEIWNVGGEWRCRARRTARNVVKLKSVDLAHAIAEADRVVGAHAVAGVGFAAAIVEAPVRVLLLMHSAAGAKIRAAEAARGHRQRIAFVPATCKEGFMGATHRCEPDSIGITDRIGDQCAGKGEQFKPIDQR